MLSGQLHILQDCPDLESKKALDPHIVNEQAGLRPRHDIQLHYPRRDNRLTMNASYAHVVHVAHGCQAASVTSV